MKREIEIKNLEINDEKRKTEMKLINFETNMARNSTGANQIKETYES